MPIKRVSTLSVASNCRNLQSKQRGSRPTESQTRAYRFTFTTTRSLGEEITRRHKRRLTPKRSCRQHASQRNVDLYVAGFDVTAPVGLLTQKVAKGDQPQLAQPIVCLDQRFAAIFQSSGNAERTGGEFDQGAAGFQLPVYDSACFDTDASRPFRMRPTSAHDCNSEAVFSFCK